jgi:thiol-disulfide isomerase/thioredoxin
MATRSSPTTPLLWGTRTISSGHFSLRTLGAGAAVKFAAALVVLIVAAGSQAAPVPELSLKDQSGQMHSLSSYRGKIVVLNFWATWCTPCRQELPMLDKVARDYAGKDVVFVAASLDDKSTQKHISGFLQKKKISLPVWVGATPGTLQQMDLGKIIPATIILDEKGDAVGRILGEARRKDIASRLDWLLNGRAGKAPSAVVTHY